MTKKLLLCVLSLLGLAANSQISTPYVVPNQDWKRYYSQADDNDNIPNAIDADNNTYMIGYTGQLPNTDLLVLKYDSLGTLIYAVPYNNGGYDAGMAIKVDILGNAYVVGVSDDATTGHDYIMLKIDPLGTIIWASRFDGGLNGIDEGRAICIDANGDAYVTGKSEDLSNSDLNIVTAKLDGSTGGVIWQHDFIGISALDDEGTGLVLSSDGQHLYVTGNTTDATNGTDIVTYALDAASGGYDWSPLIINGPANGNDKSNAIILAGANIVICGELDNTTGGGPAYGIDAVTIKIDASLGTSMWQREYDFANATNNATSLVKDSTGNIGVTGVAYNPDNNEYEYHTNLYDSTGTNYSTNIESTNSASYPVEPRIACDSIAHHWYVSGEKTEYTKNAFVYQLSPSGLTSWRQIIDGQTNDEDFATGLSVNGVGVVYVAAASKNTSNLYDLMSIKINQTPVYFPPDFAGEPVNDGHLYLKNQGQLMNSSNTFASEVLYYTQNTNPEIYIEQDAFNFVFNHSDTIESVVDTLERIQYKFLNNNPLAGHHEYLPKLTSYNYFLGYALSDAITDVQGNERVFVPNFYPSVDLHYFSGPSGIKYYLVAKPGAALGEIMMQIDGATSTAIDVPSGHLDIVGQLGNISLDQPIAYTVNWLGQVVPIVGNAAWNNVTGDIYNVSIPSYNSSLPLILQFSTYNVAGTAVGTTNNLDYSTYYGGTATEQFFDVCGRPNGDRFVTGYCTAGTFPAVNSLNYYNGNWDAVIMKYTADDTLRYATFQGGSDKDMGNSIAVDSKGEVFIGGQSFSTNMLGLNVTGATNQFNNTGTTFKADGFLAKLTGNKGILVWRRYVGGTGSDNIRSIFIDPSDNLYIAGESSSYDFPVVSPFKSTLGPTTTANPSNTDAIFGKFNSSLAAQWITYYGGSSNASGGGTATQDWGMDIVADNSGRVIGCGITDANNIITANGTGNANTFYDSAIDGSSDGFFVRYSSSGTEDFSSYFGGNYGEEISRLAYSSNNDEIYFAGSSGSSTFPFFPKAGAHNGTYSKNGVSYTSFVGYMDGNLTKNWSAFYGHGQASSKRYTTTGLSVDTQGLLYLSGYTTSDSLDYPTTTPSGVYVDNVRSGDDGFVAVFTPGKQLYHAHYFGGAGGDRILNSSIASNSKLYVTGYTGSTDFPIAYSPSNATLIDSTYEGSTDGFISRFDLALYQITELQQIDFDNAVLTIYPNPANTQFNLELPKALTSKLTVSVYTTMGQLVYQKEMEEKNMQINCESWSNGVYLVNLSNNETQKTFKVIKQ